MSSGQQLPPWLQEQLQKMQQAQQSLQSILLQKQQLEMEQIDSDKALEELKKASDDESVYMILLLNLKNAKNYPKRALLY